MAAPKAIPAIEDSARGVSITLSSPNSDKKPSVARNTPPLAPMSSPMMNTRSSFRISSRMASLIASNTVITAISFAYSAYTCLKKSVVSGYGAFSASSVALFTISFALS